MIPASVLTYLSSRGSVDPWKIAGLPSGDYQGAIVIPALAERETLSLTLDSLEKNPREILSSFFVLVVVNHSPDASVHDKQNNQQTLQGFAAWQARFRQLRLAWVDAASPGLELPVRQSGVGLARKIGFDLALRELQYSPSPPFLVSLDADTLTRPDYLSALMRHFRERRNPGAVIPFCHRPGAFPEQDRAIQRYELFLRAYVLGLSLAASPYAFHTVGSAMACTADGYVRTGGMKPRKAAEDFYFLQGLVKTGSVSQVGGTVVYPSARSSHRVPFGTGRSVSRLLAGEKGSILFYRKECFQILRDWLSLMEESWHRDGEEISHRSAHISPRLTDYLKEIHFSATWAKIQKNFPSLPTLRKGFHDWFDGLKTLRLIHFLSAGSFPRDDPERALPPLLSWAGLQSQPDLTGQLALLRNLQIGEDF
jgi:glycosyltransferase involved in cell wall biosynthesis